MPEGPSIVILREEVAGFTGQRIERAEGSAKVDKARLTGQVVREFRSWGKHLLIELEDVTVRIHLLLFGSYRINERKDSTPRLSLGFADGELNFYACSVQLIEGSLDAAYDWSTDVMSAAWSPRGTLKRLRERPRLLACDALLDQTLFAGSGNIIKNEVLYRIRVHPLSLIGELPPAKLRELVRGAHLQLPVSRLETGRRAQGQLAGARQEHLRALPDSADESQRTGAQPAPGVLLRALPEALRRFSAGGA